MKDLMNSPHQREAPGWYAHLLDNRDFRVITSSEEAKEYFSWELDLHLNQYFVQCLRFDRDAMEAFVSVTTEMAATRKPGERLEDQKENAEFFALDDFSWDY